MNGAHRRFLGSLKADNREPTPRPSNISVSETCISIRLATQTCRTGRLTVKDDHDEEGDELVIDRQCQTDED